ncbi:MAG: hypothetical protein GF308_09720 [Candidatus Heimdallarchaeota archaeon]|nr:hypothetical protein [Candidatus Heimdallarchaeota archaeon]
MSTEEYELKDLGKRYILNLLQILEEKKKEIDPELYTKLKEEYSHQLAEAKDNSTLMRGFVTFQALQPNPLTILESVEALLNHITGLDDQKTRTREKISKLTRLLTDGKISREVHDSKLREYETFIERMEEEKQELIKAIPNSLEEIQEMKEEIAERIERIEVEIELEGKKDSLKEKKEELVQMDKNITRAIKELAILAKIDYSEIEKERKKIRKPKRPEDRIKAEFTPLAEEVTIQPARNQVSTARTERTQKIIANWRGIPIGRLLGEIKIVNSTFSIILTDRPSLAVIRDFALAGHSKLKPSSNPQETEEKLRKLVQKEYNVSEEEALLPEHLVNYSFENQIGIDLFKLINSYYASVGRGAVSINREQAKINSNAQVLSLLENAGLLGRRVLAPDNSLIGVVHEFYLDPQTLELYLLTFRGVPPPVIKDIYRQTHPGTFSENRFGAFRNEISKNLSIPIYEALTPSSILKYCMLNGLITSFNQLVTIVEKMNPRISKAIDISSISSRGVILSRFPQNTLPRIELPEF